MEFERVFERFSRVIIYAKRLTKTAWRDRTPTNNADTLAATVFNRRQRELGNV